MRYVPIKNVEQQAVLALHRVRQGFVKARTAQGNQIRGLMAEFGLIIAQGLSHIDKRVPELIEDASNELPGVFRLLVQRLLEHLKELDRQVHEIEDQIVAWHRESEDSRRLAKMPGIGPITASAMVASIGDAKSFKNGRQVGAWLGLVPPQNSTGGKTMLLGMSKRGDSYLRMLLIQAFAACTMMAMRKSLRSGKLWIDHSLNFRERDQVLIPADEWARERDKLIATLGLGSSADSLLDPLLANLKAGLSAVAEACARRNRGRAAVGLRGTVGTRHRCRRQGRGRDDPRNRRDPGLCRHARPRNARAPAPCQRTAHRVPGPNSAGRALGNR